MISEHFSRSEFLCQCGCGFDTVDCELLDVLENIRSYFKRPLIITSGCRCEAHNLLVGGSPGSQHTLGRAVDFKVKDIGEDYVIKYLYDTYPNQYGIGRYTGRTHLDTRGHKSRWDMR